MAESFDLNTPQKSAEAVPMVPPSTSEVSVRTLASDIELMGKSGGMVGQGLPTASIEQVAVSPQARQAVGPTGVPTPASRGAEASPDSHWFKILMWTVVVLLGGGLLFVIGYYLPVLFGK